MVAEEFAEQMATKVIEEYANACQCDTVEDVQKALVKLGCVLGLAVRAVSDRDTAIFLMENITEQIRTEERKATMRQEMMN